MKTPRELFERRKRRQRYQLRKVSNGKLRLSVHRSNKNIFAQIIDDLQGKTLASASTLDKELRGSNGSNIAAASAVGKLVAERAKAAGVEQVVFDRGGYLYHGRVKALAEGAREGGLAF